MQKRVHVTTLLITTLAATGFLFLNLPGVIIRAPLALDDGKYGPHWENLYETCEHGWPFVYVKRKPLPAIEMNLGTPFSVWRVAEGVTEFRWQALIANIAIAVLTVGVTAVLASRFASGLGVLQFSFRFALIAMLFLSVGGGFYARARREHHREQRVLQTIGHSAASADAVRSVEYSVGGPGWMRQASTHPLLTVFDRVLAIEADGHELRHIVQLKRLKCLRMPVVSVSNEQLQQLSQLPNLEVLDLCFSSVEEAELDDPNEEPVLTLPPMPHLRGINLYGVSFRGDGLRGLPELQQLEATETECDDRALQAIGELEHLSILSLNSTDITDAGMPHFSQLTKLTELNLGHTKITDEGLSHVNSSHLTALSLEWCEITDASIDTICRFSRLKYVTITQTGVSPGGAERIRQALPQCQVIGP